MYAFSVTSLEGDDVDIVNYSNLLKCVESIVLSIVMSLPCVQLSIDLYKSNDAVSFRNPCTSKKSLDRSGILSHGC